MKGGTGSPLFVGLKSGIRKVMEKELLAIVNREIGDGEFFLVNHVRKGNHYTFFVDGDNGLRMEDLGKISRRISHAIDEEIPGEQAFVIDVSSPGADSPLVLPRQYPKHQGRTLQLALTDGAELKGTLQSVNSEGIVLEISAVKKGPRPAPPAEVKEVPFSLIKEAKIVISFK